MDLLILNLKISWILRGKTMDDKKISHKDLTQLHYTYILSHRMRKYEPVRSHAKKAFIDKDNFPRMIK